jgi:hypothetical protein
MAIVMSNLVSLTVGGTDLSDHVREIKIDMSAEDLDATAMGATSRAHAVGLRDDRMEVTFLQDYATSKVDATLAPLVSSSTGFVIVVKPNSGAIVSPTNPSYTMTSLLFDYSPIDATVGEISMPEVVFLPAPGFAIVRATA